MKTTLTVGVLVFGSFLVSRASADEQAHAQHTVILPADLKWGDGPPHLPPGQKAAVLFGDPSKPGFFIIRAKVPANYTIPPHWHPGDETVTVVSGTIMMGMGEKLDPKAAKVIPAGGFAAMPAKSVHFFISKGPAVIQVAGMGPFAITYVNPDDDPRKGKMVEKAPEKAAVAPAAAKK